MNSDPFSRDLSALSRWVSQGLRETLLLAIKVRARRFQEAFASREWLERRAQAILRGSLEKAGFQFESIHFGQSEVLLWRKKLSGTTGGPMLFVPGLSDSPFSWVTSLVGKMNAKYFNSSELVFIDFPGYPGLASQSLLFESFESQKEAVKSVMEYVAPQIVLGHSLGGWLVAKILEDRSLRNSPEEAILVAPSGMIPNEDLAAFSEVFKRAQQGAPFTEFLKLLAYDPKHFHSWIGPLFERFFQRDEFASFLSSVKPEEGVYGVPLMVRKLRVLWGEEDVLVPSRWMRLWIEAYGNDVEAILMERTGHIPQWEARDSLWNWFKNRDQESDQGPSWQRVNRFKEGKAEEAKKVLLLSNQ
jgi:pimeloyl-ACP methyl ester carboxylesterase